MNPYLVKNKPLRLIELFGGIGAQASALERLNIPFEHYRYVEFDPFPVKSYNAIHGTNFTATDIKNVKGSDLGIVDTYIHTYMMTYSFPCTDLSVAGRQAGMAKGSGTRSGLLWEVERLLNETENLPQILLMENVPQIHGTKFVADFEKWTRFLESKGYSNYWKDLNAKDFGVPQNRDRCFMISMLGGYGYIFPNKKELTLKLKDVLEDEVDEKYYLKSEKAQKLIDKIVADRNFKIETWCVNYNKVYKKTDIAKTLCARDYKGFGTTRDTMNAVVEGEQICVDGTTNNPKERDIANCIAARP